jgi:hypothetical protein
MYTAQSLYSLKFIGQFFIRFKIYTVQIYTGEKSYDQLKIEEANSV